MTTTGQPLGNPLGALRGPRATLSCLQGPCRMKTSIFRGGQGASPDYISAERGPSIQRRQGGCLRLHRCSCEGSPNSTGCGIVGTHQAPTQPQPSPLGPPSKASAMEAQVSGPQDWPPWQSRHSPLEKSPQTEGLSWQNLMGSSARARVMLYHHSPTQHHTTGSGLGLGGEK